MAKRQAHLVGLLTFTSGCVDVVTLMTLGGTFTSVVTGNLIIVGRAIGTTSLTPAVHVAVAVAGYVLGVALGSRIRQRATKRSAARATWPRAATRVLAIECVVLAAVNIAWIGYGAAPPAAATDVMLATAAIALGMQGAAARGIAGNPSTTYMTGALTALVEALATGRHRAVDASALIGLTALVAGAACGAVLDVHAARLALLPALASLALVVVIKTRDHRAEGRVVPAASARLGFGHVISGHGTPGHAATSVKGNRRSLLPGRAPRSPPVSERRASPGCA